jgi:hypothetical protein
MVAFHAPANAIQTRNGEPPNMAGRASDDADDRFRPT